MDHLDAIRRESALFYDTAERTDPSRPVPSCPDWNVSDLVWHLGEVHWFWATDVESRASDPGEIEKGKPARPDTYPELVAFGRAQADRLARLLDETPDDVPVWTWALDEADHSVGFVRRHQVQEAAVHRWDLQNATAGDADAIAPDAASDSIEEVLAITVPWSVRPDRALAGSVHIHCTDVPGEWLLHPDGRVEPIHAKGDVAIRGTASDILLAFYGRIPLDSVDLIGDTGLAHELVARVNTE